jgi:hypothetical protein
MVLLVGEQLSHKPYVGPPHLQFLHKDLLACYMQVAYPAKKSPKLCFVRLR